MPWMARIQIAFLMAATDAARRQNGTVNRTLLSIIEPKTSAKPKPIAGVCTSDVTIDPTRNLWMRIFAPAEPVEGEKLPLVIYIHGGGFTFFSPSTGPYDDFGRRICRKIRAVVLSINYRLAPEHRCPAAYDDGVDVLKFMDSGELGSVGILSGLDLDLSSCFLAGDSAGGNIIHHVARRWAAAVDSWEHVIFLPFYLFILLLH
jgi:acetyl esterase/lipase